MQNDEYEIVYLPQARLDINEILNYILDKLKNPTAAERFIDNLEKKIENLAHHPYICAIYKWNHKFDYEYRQIFVGNYMVFYVMMENFVEIHRVIHTTRNMELLI